MDRVRRAAGPHLLLRYRFFHYLKGIVSAMEKRFIIGAIIGVFTASFSSAMAVVTAPKVLPDGMRFAVDGGTRRMKVKVDKQTETVALLDLRGKMLLRETAQGRLIAPATQPGVMGNSCALTFEAPGDEGVYGLG